MLTAAVILLAVFVVAGGVVIELSAIGMPRIGRAIVRTISFFAGVIAYSIIATINK